MLNHDIDTLGIVGEEFQETAESFVVCLIEFLIDSQLSTELP
jgi:hypothetical protein